MENKNLTPELKLDKESLQLLKIFSVCTEGQRSYMLGTANAFDLENEVEKNQVTA